MKDLLNKFGKYQTIIFPVLVGVACIAIFILVILPQILGFFKGQQDLRIASEKKKTLDVKAAELESLDQAILDQKLVLVTRTLPIDKDISSAIGLLQQVTADSGTVLVSLQFGQSQNEPTGNASTINVKAEVSGPKEAFNGLLANIEKSSRVMKITSIDMTSSQATQALTASLSIDVYYEAIPKQNPSIEAALPKITAEEEEIIAKLAQTPVRVAEPTSAALGPRGKANPFE